MSNGRNEKISPLGFHAAALAYTRDLSPEAATNLTNLVRDVARQYHDNDSTALNRLKTRLNIAAKRRTTREWAQEVLTFLADKKKERLMGATV